MALPANVLHQCCDDGCGGADDLGRHEILLRVFGLSSKNDRLTDVTASYLNETTGSTYSMAVARDASLVSLLHQIVENNSAAVKDEKSVAFPVTRLRFWCQQSLLTGRKETESEI